MRRVRIATPLPLANGSNGHSVMPMRRWSWFFGYPPAIPD
jgi:hypothetical protein